MIVGALNWFDERPSWLAACVGSMSKLCDHVVAFDGAYAGFGGLEHRSSPEQAEVIARTADGLGMGWTIHVPKDRWWGGEVEKRAALLEAARHWGDWVLVLDADEVLADAWHGTRTQLAETDRDVAEVMITDEWGGRVPIRRLFRALPNLTVEQAHYVVTARKDGRKVVLCGDQGHHEQEESLLLSDVLIHHRSGERDPERRRLEEDYYARHIPQEQRRLEVIR